MSSLEHLSRINDICLFVGDFDAAVKFYTEKFGFTLKRLQPDEENANYAEFTFRDTTLSMWAKSGVATVMDPSYFEGKGHSFMIAIRVPTPEDVDAIHKELTSRGVTCISPPKTYEFGARPAYYTDFEGNIWEVFAWLEGMGPGLV
jgi:uncharacterized glyoxalase superfamily protein PhnB